MNCFKQQKPNEAEKFLNNFFTYTVIEDQNFGSKKTMEDFTIVELDLTGNGRLAFFCILDGHGGAEVAAHAKANLPKILQKCFKDTPAAPYETILSQSIDKLSKQLLEQERFHCGSTLCGVLIDRLTREFFTINIGDSRAYTVHRTLKDKGEEWELTQLTVDHKLSHEGERERVRTAGGLMNNRVGGQILVTRAIGDFNFQQYGLIYTPDIKRHKLDREKYLMIGSDGVWDFVDASTVVAVLNDPSVTGSASLTKALVNEALKKSMDNISLIVVAIKF
jgi:serine/threonine protein phosphatase PrpC